MVEFFLDISKTFFESSVKDIWQVPQPFCVWCSLKGHTYLFKYVWPFSGNQALRG